MFPFGGELSSPISVKNDQGAQFRKEKENKSTAGTNSAASAWMKTPPTAGRAQTPERVFLLLIVLVDSKL